MDTNHELARTSNIQCRKAKEKHQVSKQQIRTPKDQIRMSEDQIRMSPGKNRMYMHFTKTNPIFR